MYKKLNTDQRLFGFCLPFGGKLEPQNRWVIMSVQIPWAEIDQKYSCLFTEEETGSPALPARVGLGALIIQGRLGLTDRETVEQIRENPYLQYFLGNTGYRSEAPFHHTMMVHFRKRFSTVDLAAINGAIVKGALARAAAADGDGDDAGRPPAGGGGTPPTNEGKLIIDATCTPADITYPTDLKLLNEAREKTEAIIDTLHAPYAGREPKPRTYRKKARKAFLCVVMQKKAGPGQIRKAIGKQLGYVKRNLGAIERMAREGRLPLLSRRLYRLLLVISEVYRQQRQMYESRTHRVDDRIVNLYQPHIRPIVRGKAGSPVEFGAKISVSLVDGFGYVEHLSFDAYNESGDLQSQVERYKERYGHYPASVHADKIYRTRDNRRFCAQWGIRLSGPALGRPVEATTDNEDQLKALKRQQHQDEIDRIAIEGKFGQGKRRFTLARIMARLADTATTVIMVAFIVMNLEKILAGLLLCLFFVWSMARKAVCNALWACRRVLSELRRGPLPAGWGDVCLCR